ncbi:hypothetical protein PR202_gb25192 [Eleusine coracana subsp. coracana]|uniref:DUF6598 domain-containing protein n=1 Tax=Eleusine coracana subsp. coracana TaxID=191504 RepID=A0AAV5FKM5_ELECO|nr:hypothetical protein PR202_gb25192 [Eleusine coracana subsp. coracana]
MANGGDGFDSGRCSSVAAVDGYEHDDDGEVEDCVDLEPFFFDEAEAIADHERQTRREQEEAHKKELRVSAAKANKAVRDAIRDYDPKQGGEYYNRFFLADFSVFDINEEFVKDAVEATLAIEVLQGEFYGKITACTSSIPSSSILLHDSSKVAGNCAMICGGKRVIKLLRRVVAVCLKEKLQVTPVAQIGTDVQCEGTIAFTPSLHGGDKGEISVGATKMVVEVTWSVIDI